MAERRRPLRFATAFACTLAVAVRLAGAAPADDANAADRTSGSPIAWTTLGAQEQAHLADLHDSWDQLPPAAQARFRRAADDWDELTAARRERVQQRIARWAQMTPEHRARLRREYEQMSPDEQHAFIAGAMAQQRANERASGFGADLAPEQRAAVRDLLRSLSPEQRHSLRRAWRALPPSERAAFRARLLALPPEQRAAELERMSSAH